MKTALSLYFLLIKTESSFFRFGRIEIAKILKLGTAANGFPCIVIVLRSTKCLIFYSSARSAI